MRRAEAGLLQGLPGGREPLISGGVKAGAVSGECSGGAAWGKVTLEVGLPFCTKPCAKCRVLRDVSDLVSTPRSPHLGVCRPKPNNPRES